MTTTTDQTDHEHEWEVVQLQTLYEGYPIQSISFEGDEETQTMFVRPADDPKWGEVAEIMDEKISCVHCAIEYPYPNGGWEVSWY